MTKKSDYAAVYDEMSFEDKVALGLLEPSIFPVNKYGRSTNVDSTATDIWDLTASQPIWLAPTAARVHAIASDSANDVPAVGTLTLAANIANTKTVTIGTKVYTFQATLTNDDGNVKIGANASASIDNLIAAINLAAGSGTTYAAAMTENSAGVVAYVGAGDTMLLYVTTPTAIATTETDSNASWGAAATVVGTGAHMVRVYGLKTWNDVETSEDIPPTGVDDINTSDSFVIIHRIKALTWGTAGPNVGIITATAASDSTVTAQILAGEGQTQMAILGIPSVQTLLIKKMYADLNKAGGLTPLADIKAFYNPIPQTLTTKFVNKHTFGLIATGSSRIDEPFDPPKKFIGPGILKIQALASTTDLDISAGFNGKLYLK